MNLTRKVLLSIVVMVVVYFGWCKYLRDPGRPDDQYYHPDVFQISADIDGKPISDTIGLEELLPFRFRCPVPEGFDKKTEFRALLLIVRPATYTGNYTEVAYQQIQGGKPVSLTVGGPTGTKDVTPPYPRKDENVFQFCALLHGKSIDMKDKTSTPLEMHLGLFPLDEVPLGEAKKRDNGEWVYRHAFQFVDDATAK